MDNDPYDDTALQWLPPQKQATEGTYQRLPPISPDGRLRSDYKPRRSVQERFTNRMSKAEALERVTSLKKYILVGSLLSFGALSMLVANQISATANASPADQPPQSPAGPAMQDPSSQPMPSDSGGFFRHHGGYDFGSGSSPSAPFTRSHSS